MDLFGEHATVIGLLGSAAVMAGALGLRRWKRRLVRAHAVLALLVIMWAPQVVTLWSTHVTQENYLEATHAIGEWWAERWIDNITTTTSTTTTTLPS